MSEEKNQPIYKIKSGAMAASIWRKDGNNGPWYQADVQRAYLGQDEKWHYTTSFSRDELPVVLVLLQMAYGWILIQEDKDKEAEQPQANRKPFRTLRKTQSAASSEADPADVPN